MTNAQAHALDALYRSLDQRPRPEDVAELILDVVGKDLSKGDRAIVEVAAAGSLKRSVHGFSSMWADFHRPVAPSTSAQKAVELFADVQPLSAADCLDVDVVRAFVVSLGEQIRRVTGAPFLAGRMNRQQRRVAGVEHSRRRYNKLFRFLQRFEQKLERYALELRKYRAMRVAKAGLSSTIRRADFDADVYAACFCAYAAARRNRRSAFTNAAQDRFYDDVCRVLQAKVSPSSPGAWRAIARVMPDAKVVQRLYEVDRLELFGAWTSILADLALLLRDTWARSGFNRTTMVVKRGDDSSTWNALAGAWNEARRGWFAVACATGLDDVIDDACFGKVMRLMAGDVAAWHRSGGGDLEPDTAVWAALPAPWEVFSGEKSCPKALVVEVCRRHGVDAKAKGWTAPLNAERSAVPFRPTPELVHGVAVAHPALAVVLKKSGAFSGKA